MFLTYQISTSMIQVLQYSNFLNYFLGFSLKRKIVLVQVFYEVLDIESNQKFETKEDCVIKIIINIIRYYFLFLFFLFL